jgi:hypothetical protein
MVSPEKLAANHKDSAMASQPGKVAQRLEVPPENTQKSHRKTISNPSSAF